MTLPPETLALVFRHLPQTELVRILTTSSLVHHLAARVLYHTLVDIPPRRAIRLLHTLASNDLYPALVRRLDLEWSNNTLTANTFHLLHRTLRRLVHLAHLSLEFAATSPSSAWILQDTPFTLRVFTTSIRCDAHLARFLESQPALVELCLRGFHLTRTFAISPSALPRLTHLRTVLASPSDVAGFMRGRPIESVSMSVYPGDTAPSLDALLLSTRPVKRLTVMCFDTVSPATLIRDIAVRLPALEALHAVAPSHHTTEDLLVQTAHALSHFKALRYLTLMAPGTFTPENESEIATLWHTACPTLKTIILPKGIVWEYTNGRWVSLQDAA